MRNLVVPPEAKISGDLEIDARFGSSPLSSKDSVISKSISKTYIFLEILLETCVRTDDVRLVERRDAFASGALRAKNAPAPPALRASAQGVEVAVDARIDKPQNYGATRSERLLRLTPARCARAIAVRSSLYAVGGAVAATALWREAMHSRKHGRPNENHENYGANI